MWSPCGNSNIWNAVSSPFNYYKRRCLYWEGSVKLLSFMVKIRSVGCNKRGSCNGRELCNYVSLVSCRVMSFLLKFLILWKGDWFFAIYVLHNISHLLLFMRVSVWIFRFCSSAMQFPFPQTYKVWMQQPFLIWFIIDNDITSKYFVVWFSGASHRIKKISQIHCCYGGVHYNTAATCLVDWGLCGFLYLIDFEVGRTDNERWKESSQSITWRPCFIIVVCVLVMKVLCSRRWFRLFSFLLEYSLLLSWIFSYRWGSIIRDEQLEHVGNQRGTGLCWCKSHFRPRVLRWIQIAMRRNSVICVVWEAIMTFVVVQIGLGNRIVFCIAMYKWIVLFQLVCMY